MVVNIPIVSLDKIYIDTDRDDFYFLDCTRVNGSSRLISRCGERLDRQILEIASKLRGKDIILADDVVFTGSVLKKIIDIFSECEINVVGIVSAVSTSDGYSYFNNNLKYGLKCNYLLGDDVIDQVCERDFYFGIAGSGIMVSTENGLCKSPYFKPYGNPYERASIPEEYVDLFSKGCLERSLYLWEEMERGTDKKYLIGDLPEKIINTNSEDEVVKVLRMEMKRL